MQHLVRDLMHQGFAFSANTAVQTLKKRGLSTYPDHVNNGGNDGSKPVIEVPAWGMVVMFLTSLFGFLFIASVQYTIGDVIGTLTMVETPSTAITLTPVESEQEPSMKNDAKDSLLETGLPTVTVSNMKPITSGIRKTIKHITSIGGRFARWRGLAPAIAYSFCVQFVYGILARIIPSWFPFQVVFVNLFSALIFMRLHMVWTHSMISMPTTTRFYKRILPFKTTKHLALPTAVNILASYVVVYLVAGAAILMSLMNSAIINKYQEKNNTKAFPAWIIAILLAQGLLLLAFTIGLGLLILVPAAATLIRVEASMLPADQDTIVPFDRSFDGKVVPAVAGGTGAIGFLDAWRTFSWEARRRVVKLFVKYFLIVIALVVLFVHIVGFEAWAIMGKDIMKAVDQARANARNGGDWVPKF